MQNTGKCGLPAAVRCIVSAGPSCSSATMLGRNAKEPKGIKFRKAQPHERGHSPLVQLAQALDRDQG